MEKRIVLGGLGLCILMALTGCEEKEKVQAVKSVPQPVETAPATPVIDQVKAKVLTAAYVLPSCKGTICPEINIMRFESNYDWLDGVVNQEVENTLKQLIDMPVMSNIPAKDNEAQQTQSASALQPYVDQLLALNQEVQALGANHQISVMISPKLIQAQAPIATVAVVSSSYLGGAHGSSHQAYLNFDLAQKRQIQLKDILLKDQNLALEKAAYQAFQQWAKEMQQLDSTQEYEQMWPFSMTDNFYLGTQGLVLQYAEYEIGPYVVGLPRLVIPYTQLRQILKPEYLPESLR